MLQSVPLVLKPKINNINGHVFVCLSFLYQGTVRQAVGTGVEGPPCPHNFGRGNQNRPSKGPWTTTWVPNLPPTPLDFQTFLRPCKIKPMYASASAFP